MKIVLSSCVLQPQRIPFCREFCTLSGTITITVILLEKSVLVVQIVRPLHIFIDEKLFTVKGSILENTSKYFILYNFLCSFQPYTRLLNITQLNLKKSEFSTKMT